MEVHENLSIYEPVALNQTFLCTGQRRRTPVLPSQLAHTPIFY